MPETTDFYSFPRYLHAKQSVDDRALNKDVFNALRRLGLPARPRLIEVGGGIGTMLRRLVRWDVLREAEYVLVDEAEENIEYALAWIPQWARQVGLHGEQSGPAHLRLWDAARDIRVQLLRADVFDFVATAPEPADLLIAHAFLDLLPLPESLPRLLALTCGPAWLTVNFDGLTTFEPVIDPALDEMIERLYHASMDQRPTGGDSRSGRHLFQHLREARMEILEAGPSDWVVHARDGKYPEDEAYFLKFILRFFEQSLRGHPALASAALEAWLQARRAQIERGELVYIAHQMDFLVRPAGQNSVKQFRSSSV